MTPFTTDAGTLQLMASLTRAGRCVLEGFLRRCDAQRTTSPSEHARLDGIHFERTDVRHMKLERKAGCRDRRVRATTRFTNTATWCDGRLLLAGVDMPETVSAAAAGRRLDEMIDDAPLHGMAIRRCARLTGPVLSIHCDGGVGEIPYGYSDFGVERSNT